MLLTATPLAAALALSVASAPQAATDADITLERIFADPEWIARSPERPFWAPDNAALFYWRERAGADVQELWSVGVEPGAAPARVENAQRSTVVSPGGDWSRARDLYAFERSGDLFVHELASGTTRQLARTAERESSPRFVEGDAGVAFRRGDATYVFELASGLVRQVADLRAKDDPDDESEDFDYLGKKQERLFDELKLRERLEKEDEDEERRLHDADPTRTPRPFYFGEDVELVRHSASPDGRWLFVVTRPKGGTKGERGSMPTYVTGSGYVEARDVRRRVGRDAPSGHTLHLIDLETRAQHELAFDGLPGLDLDPFEELRPAAIEWHVERGADREELEKELKAPDERAVTVDRIEWAPVGSGVALQLAAVDNKDRWLVGVDLVEPQLHARHHLHDDAWVNWRASAFGWLADGTGLWLLSEEDGFSQVWVQRGDEAAQRVTDGGFVALSPELSPDGRFLYFRANATDPAVWEIFRIDLERGATEQITQLGGTSTFGLAPDGSALWVLHSKVDQPPELYLQLAEPGATARRLTETVSPEFAALPWAQPEIVDVPSSHVERPVRARLYRPADFDRSRKWPAVIFVHGAGYLQNVHAGWSHYFREYLFHTWLTREGFVVLDLDYRGSAGYGRDWRTAVYRQMGHPEVEDLRDAVEWLAREQAVDDARVGVYGGSYGGFLAFMALFRDPDLFAAGAALRPVTDWSHYNHGYTSNILNTPELDPVAYERSSPIEFAEGLTKPLLICAGMQDDNVFFQDTVLLVQRLIELEKENFETAFYPLEPHSFRRPESWLDEYRRIAALFQRFLLGSG